ncbi:hypothetical protein D3C81_2106470 [compost metagenome]
MRLCEFEDTVRSLEGEFAFLRLNQSRLHLILGCDAVVMPRDERTLGSYNASTDGSPYFKGLPEHFM